MIALFDREDSSIEKEINKVDWGNYKLPSINEFKYIKNFGKYNNFNNYKNISKRVNLEIANLKYATRIIIYHHYLHRGRTMAQLAYWILIDNIKIGVILYSLPRISSKVSNIHPMSILELARLWINPDVQGKYFIDSKGHKHSVNVASCAISKSLKIIRKDWFIKYPNLPRILAIISWCDDSVFTGTVYKASNFINCGKSGGSMHGNSKRKNGGKIKLRNDFINLKTKYLYKFKGECMKRRYEYRCLECKKIFEIKHNIEDKISTYKCSNCNKIVAVEKLISGTSFKIMWNI